MPTLFAALPLALTLPLDDVDALGVPELPIGCLMSSSRE